MQDVSFLMLCAPLQPKYPPTREALSTLVSGLPVQVHSEQEVANGYCGILQVCVGGGGGG